ncbi:antibiotic biosynthesis monooxygenase family protein [Iningainema tapete]|uniref:Antibiotic biosynthesis monooxygenase n=1 Tax=Iningainema tapete BLCC-T55 TaxID=2748662 RepID=A0A8J6XL49_9CYAN|nr:antibiotic biosynthesis monooxygenase [Iningainema tapete]MBD2772866.1 antibiotic biosynthesis monooxygenase [Iningainema tapete BLCC-T55]
MLLPSNQVSSFTLVRKQPGFLAANFHRSLDGTKVVNYVQWASIEASRAIHHNPDISNAFASYQELGVSMDLRYYETAFTHRQSAKQMYSHLYVIDFTINP